MLSVRGLGCFVEQWHGTRGNKDRVLVQVVGVDADYREYGKGGDNSEEVINDLPAGATVKVKMIALNGALDQGSIPDF